MITPGVTLLTPSTEGFSSRTSAYCSSAKTLSTTVPSTSIARVVFWFGAMGMSIVAVDQPWLRLPTRVISPLRTNQTSPEESTSLVIRNPTSCTVPTTSPVSIRSPTPNWSSKIMRMPEM